MSLTLIFSGLFIHWVADFILQTDAQAKGKSTDNGFLVSHTAIYSTVWWFCVSLFCLFTGQQLVLAVIFAAITWLAHTVTDYYTSRLNSYLWKKGDVHNFFVSVGFDQVLHYVQLILTWILIFG